MKRLFIFIFVSTLLVFSCKQADVDVLKVCPNFEHWRTCWGMTFEEVKAFENNKLIREEPILLVYKLKLFNKYDCELTYSFWDFQPASVKGRISFARYKILNPNFEDYEFFRNMLIRLYGTPKVITDQSWFDIWKLAGPDVEGLQPIEIRFSFAIRKGNGNLLAILHSIPPPVF